MIEYRQAKKSEAKELALLFDKAFYGYLFHDLLAQNIKHKDKFVFSFLYSNIMVYIKRRSCFVGIVDGRIVSAVLLRQYGKQEPTLVNYAFSGGLKLLFMAGISKLRNLFSVLEEAEKDCKEFAKTSNKNVWFLEQIAVDKFVQGQQLGSKIITDLVLPYIKKNGGEVLTLITNSEKNRKFYAKNSFIEFGESLIKRKDLEVGNWSFKKDV